MKGFGFITTPEGTDIFSHVKACVDGGVPQQGDQVSYEFIESTVKPGQMQAGNVMGGTGVAGEKGAGKGGGPQGPPGGTQAIRVPDTIARH